jgi:hypothetical protein
MCLLTSTGSKGARDEGDWTYVRTFEGARFEAYDPKTGQLREFEFEIDKDELQEAFDSGEIEQGVQQS